jgi:hypothetical protein
MVSNSRLSDTSGFTICLCELPTRISGEKIAVKSADLVGKVESG